ncbi:hypothetical protein FOCG_13853 [Fusarium oxysporum f. sp. radicis-lycopersici 26381]|nr:hypothetical protein FOCG_13853 [Fusarium oxysporum f. sp. radicis-lycopersici 26381]RKL31097.1 hypothetical protein BFJ70_g9841 [Fusarium oxysporum]
MQSAGGDPEGRGGSLGALEFVSADLFLGFSAALGQIRLQLSSPECSDNNAEDISMNIESLERRVDLVLRICEDDQDIRDFRGLEAGSLDTDSVQECTLFGREYRSVCGSDHQGSADNGFTLVSPESIKYIPDPDIGGF